MLGGVLLFCRAIFPLRFRKIPVEPMRVTKMPVSRRSKRNIESDPENATPKKSRPLEDDEDLQSSYNVGGKTKHKGA